MGHYFMMLGCTSLVRQRMRSASLVDPHEWCGRKAIGSFQRDHVQVKDSCHECNVVDGWSSEHQLGRGYHKANLGEVLIKAAAVVHGYITYCVLGCWGPKREAPYLFLSVDYFSG